MDRRGLEEQDAERGRRGEEESGRESCGRPRSPRRGGARFGRRGGRGGPPGAAFFVPLAFPPRGAPGGPSPRGGEGGGGAWGGACPPGPPPPPHSRHRPRETSGYSPPPKPRR